MKGELDRTEVIAALVDGGEAPEWATPFDPIEMGHSKKWRDYTESNAWQATFGIQHDVTGYIALLGGDEAFVAKLDSLFNQPSKLPSDAPPDIAGLPSSLRRVGRVTPNARG